MGNVKIDFSDIVGRIRPLHGTNSGPKTYGFYLDTTKYFIEAGLPYSRLHDTEYPFGSGQFVDIPCIFKNFDADPYDPESYYFTQTDEYIKAIYAAGTQVFYRLGVSIEHTPVKKNVYPPKDPKKWAVICEHIIRHYNEGWANGFSFGIEYWEIWNEPEGEGTWRTSMWMGTNEQYFELYCTTAMHLKACFPNIKVGGYASCGFYGITNPAGGNNLKYIEFAELFFKAITAEKAPLDFFSWHIYSDNLKLYKAHSKYARELMARYGFEKSECILDEWNYGGEDMFRRMTTEIGASHAAGAMITMQHTGVDLATYYDGQPAMPYCGIFDHATAVPTKAFYAFKGWNELYKLKNEASSTADDEDYYVCAAVNGNEAAVLFSSYKAAPSDVVFDISGFECSSIEVETYVVDSNSNLCDLRSVESLNGTCFKLVKKADSYTMIMLKLKNNSLISDLKD